MDIENMEKSIHDIERYVDGKQGTLDELGSLCKKVIRTSGVVITMLHNGVDVESRLEELNSLTKSLSGYGDEFRYHTIQAYQEYSEAVIFHSIKTGGRLPSYTELRIPPEAYLLGAMDVVGELRREITDSLSKSNVEAAESYYNVMKRIFDTTRGMRYTDSVLPGFRRKQDVARIQMENSGSDILVSKKRAH